MRKKAVPDSTENSRKTVFRNKSPHSDYMLRLTFENGEQRWFDMKPYLDFGVFSTLKHPEVFNTVRVYRDTIAWGNDVDLDPEILYPNSAAQK